MSDTSGTDRVDTQTTQNSVPATDNDSGEAITENSSGGAKGKSRITTQGKEKLWLYFSKKQNLRLLHYPECDRNQIEMEQLLRRSVTDWYERSI
eukprot:scaffold46414_cov41-Attheya_sp.AAC.2